MAALIIITTGTESTLGFDAMSTPAYLEKLSPAVKRTLSHFLMGEARKLVEAENRHTPKPGFEDAAEHAIMSSDMHFESIIDLDNAMCFTAFGMQVERERCIGIVEDYARDHGKHVEWDRDGSIIESVADRLCDLIRGEA